VIADGGNSGFQALNIALQFGLRPIILVGFDMRLDAGLHWHGPHPPGLNNPSDKNLVHWRRCFETAAGQLQGFRVPVINASLQSTLQGFPKVPLAEALKKCSRRF
jgi:hypothetical protein